jgi:hypothetical protein
MFRPRAGAAAECEDGHVERRKLLATAGAVTISAFATTVGLGASFGLFGVTEPDSPVGRLDSRRAAVEAHAVPAPAPVTTTPPGADADD